MPRTCTICSHPERAEIERALVSRQPYRKIASTHAVGKDSLMRHFKNHLRHLLATLDVSISAELPETTMVLQRKRRSDE